MGKQLELRPFHETIVEAIEKASNLDEVGCLTELLQNTKVPQNHGAIIAAINENWERWLCDDGWKNYVDQLKASLRQQKKKAESEAAAAKASVEKKSFNLDELQQETEKLLALLKDRQPGLMTWNEFLCERLRNLYELTSRAVSK